MPSSSSRNSSRNQPRPASHEPGWGMLVYESVSAGAMAVLLTIAIILVLVGAYTFLVWPLTKWDMASVDGGTFTTWMHYAIGLVFAVGTITGFWCFSGAAFRQKAAQRRNHNASR